MSRGRAHRRDTLVAAPGRATKCAPYDPLETACEQVILSLDGDTVLPTARATGPGGPTNPRLSRGRGWFPSFDAELHATAPIPLRMSSSSAARSAPPAFTRDQRFVVAMLAFLQFTIVLDFMVLSPLGVFVMPALSISPAEFSRVVSAYAIAAAISGVMPGRRRARTSGEACSESRKSRNSPSVKPEIGSNAALECESRIRRVTSSDS